MANLDIQMDTTPEQEQPTTEIVHLDEVFTPFDPQKTKRRYDDQRDIHRFDRIITVETGEIPDFSITSLPVKTKNS